jgi:PelA/Pel-15E family pectate lyase
MRRTRTPRTAGRLAACAVLLVAAVPAACAAAQQGSGANDRNMLSAARIDSLPPAQRQAWREYIARSRRLAALDSAEMRRELAATGQTAMKAAPNQNGSTVIGEHPAAWYRSPEGKRIADVILTYQTPSGGWSKRVDLAAGPRRPGTNFTSDSHWSYIGTIDNGSTTGQMRTLAGEYAVTHDARYAASFLRGLDYLFEAQQPTGCWPQVYPLQGGYHDAGTFNDDAMVHVLRLLQDVSGGRYDFVPDSLRRRAAARVRRGTECILNSQVRVSDTLTVWCAQNDPLTLVPVKARSYEFPSLSGGESVGVMEFLMDLPDPGPRVVRAVRAAADWFRKSAIYGYDYTYKGKLVPKDGAGPIWARFYEIGTNRPIFSGRNGIIRYRMDQIEPERRYGYAWYRTDAVGALKQYDTWSQAHPGKQADRP